MAPDNDLAVFVEGRLACFTRPEYAAERVSYPVITPPAAAGLLSAIFWKPEFRWVIRRIWVVNPIAWHSMTKNEVSSRASSRVPHIDVLESRVQRHSLVLRDVAYVLFGSISPRPHAVDPVAKYREQFRRRIERGACFSRPYLGLQEFHAEFRPLRADDAPNRQVTLPVGSMPLDLRFADEKGTERIDPLFWPASIVEGVLDVPALEPRDASQ